MVILRMVISYLFQYIDLQYFKLCKPQQQLLVAIAVEVNCSLFIGSVAFEGNHFSFAEFLVKHLHAILEACCIRCFKIISV